MRWIPLLRDGGDVKEETATIRALRQLERQTTVSVPSSDDEEGYFDRECPSDECNRCLRPTVF